MRKLVQIGALAFIALGQAQSAILIDNFETFQSLVAGPGGSNPLSVSSNVVTGVNAIGGYRFAEVTRIAGGGRAELNVDQFSPGVATFSNTASTDGNLYMLWDGNANNVRDHGLSVDLTEGGNATGINISFRSDLVVTSFLTVYSGEGNASRIAFNTNNLGTAVPFTTLQLGYSSFTTIAGTGVDFANVTAIELFFQGPASFDLEIDLLQTAVPEPTSILLMGAGLLGLIALKLRK